MHSPALFDAHPSDASQSLPGCWKIEAGRALTLRPHRSGVLRIAHGRLWVTMDDPQAWGQASGDLFLVPGRGLVVAAGQRIVLESYGAGQPEAAYFSWDPLPAAHAAALDAAARGVGRWQAVVLPLRDLGQALGQAGTAAGRLLLGLARLPGLGAARQPTHQA